MAGPPSKYSFLSKQFFSVGGLDRLRPSASSFISAPSTEAFDLLPRGNHTFCGAAYASTTSQMPASPRTLRVARQARDGSFVSLSSTISTVCSSSQLASPLPQDLRLQGWMYWARNDDGSKDEEGRTASQCYTKVYAVLRNEFLLLYRNNKRSSKRERPAPLVQIAVASAGTTIDGALHVKDPYGEGMELHLYDREDAEILQQWAEALEQAAELTASHFSVFDVKVEDLSRTSMFRGTLHDFRAQRATTSSLRRSVSQLKKFRSWHSLRQFIPSRRLNRKKFGRPSSP